MYPRGALGLASLRVTLLLLRMPNRPTPAAGQGGAGRGRVARAGLSVSRQNLAGWLAAWLPACL